MHLRLTGVGATLAVAAAFAAMAFAPGSAPAAGAAVTASHITTPANSTYYMDNQDTGGQSITVSGTTNGGTTGDAVDILCYYGTSSYTFATNVPVQKDGSFSVTAPLKPLDYSECTLRAVPAGSAPSDVKPFAGPTIGVDEAQTYDTGNTPYDYYLWGQQSKGAFDYQSLGSCGLEDGYLFDSSLKLSTVTFWCNAYLWRTTSANIQRSELQIDGVNAYPSDGAKSINANATGLPAVAYSYSVDKKTGNVQIHETDPLVKCPDQTYPATSSSCPSFTSTGVVDHRTITQNTQGEVSWITDKFVSVDTKAHKLDLLWENDNRFHSSSGGDASQLQYQFPGHSGYSTHLTGDTVSLPAKPGTIRLRMQDAADGDTSTGRGAIVYDRAAKGASFIDVGTSDSAFVLHQTASIKARTSTQFRFAYVQAYKQSTVDSLAQLATKTFQGCTVPDVTGKTLAAAEKAIEHAGCTVGKVTKASSSTVKAGSVISESPKAHAHVAYEAKVALVVSKGK